MALEVGGAQKIFDRNQGIYNDVQASDSFADFLAGQRGNLFDYAVAQTNINNAQPYAEKFGNGNLGGMFGIARDVGSAERLTDAARLDFQSLSDDELAAMVGGSTLANPAQLSLAGNNYTLLASPLGNLLPPSLADDAGGVYSAFAADKPHGYDIGSTSFEDIYNALKGTDADTFGLSQNATLGNNIAREAKPGLAELAVGLGAAGTIGGAFKAAGFTNPLKGFGNGLFSPSNAGNAVPGLSTGVTTPLGGAAITGTGQAAPLLGIAGGAPLGASPLAIAGGATALPGVQGLPTGGKIPGTNINVGTPDGAAFNVDPKDVLRTANTIRQVTGLGAEQPTGTGGGAAIPGAPYRGPVLYDGNPYPDAVTKLPAYLSYLRS